MIGKIKMMWRWTPKMSKKQRQKLMNLASSKKSKEASHRRMKTRKMLTWKIMRNKTLKVQKTFKIEI